METNASFDTWTTLFLVVSAVGTFLSILLFTDRRGRSHNWPIALLILGFSIILVQYVLFWTKYNLTYPYLNFFDVVAYLSFGPLFYAYIRKLYRKDAHLNFAHFLPSIILLCLALYYISLRSLDIPIIEINNQPAYRIYRGLAHPWVGIIHLLVYVLISFDFIKLNKPTNETTEEQLIRNKWVQILTRSFMIFVLAYLSYYVLVNFSFFSPAWDYAISIAMSICVYGIGYMVYTEPKIFNGELLQGLFLKKDEKEPRLSSETKEEFFQSLTTYFSSEKPYRNNELRLVHVADKLGFSTHLLSKLINEKAGKNFNRFTNDYRLKDAEQLLISAEIKKVSNLYFDVGFNSKATFYNLFKEKHGCTPTQYRSQNSKG